MQRTEGRRPESPRERNAMTSFFQRHVQWNNTLRGASAEPSAWADDGGAEGGSLWRRGKTDFFAGPALPLANQAVAYSPSQSTLRNFMGSVLPSVEKRSTWLNRSSSR